MKKIQHVYNCFCKLYKDKDNKGISAVELSEYMKLDRANVSRYLNNLYKEGKIDKVEGRPVIYVMNKLQSDKDEENTSIKSSSFEKMVGATLSLNVPIQQAKAAILYPPHGLHTLILGETGVGKSMFAEQMYLFAKKSNVIKPNAPFVRFNCADYADNPQLVIAQIFGVKKGAYTGAESDREGLLKKADGGIIFLDEIHRLSPQAQEMLFTYIDKGSFRALGDTERLIKADAQIIAATTEDPKSFMLRTFTRRIPMTITLPSLKDRTMEERYYLLEQFIKSESARLGENIYFNKNALTSFLLYDCPNNIGQLKSDIQLACAKAFLNYKANGKNVILVEQSDLHPRVKKGLMNLQEHRIEVNNILANEDDVVKFSFKENEDNFKMNNEETISKGDYFYNAIEDKLEELKKKGLDEKQISNILNIEINKYFKKYIRELSSEYKKDEILKIVDASIVNTVEEILSMASKKLDRKYGEKVFFGLALHLQGSLERIKLGKTIYHPKLDLVRVQHGQEFVVAMEAAKIIDEKFGMQIPLDEIGYLTMFLATKPREIEEKKDEKVAVVVIMHGESTASSMVDVVNKLIGEEHVTALDMPLNMKAEKMYEVAKNKVKGVNEGKGVLLLVDMGSLTNFADMIKDDTGIEVKTVDMVTTLLAIEAGRKAIAGKELDDIYKSCINLSRNGLKAAKYQNEIKENIIITACFTGEGSAEKLKQLLTTKLKYNDKVKIIPLNILDKKDFEEKVEQLRSEYNVLAIVGTVNIDIEGLKFIPAPDVLVGEGITKLDELIHIEEDYAKICKSMDSQIKDMDGINLVYMIRESICEMEDRLEVIIPHEVKLGIVIHLCFLIEKTVNGDKTVNFEKLSEYRGLHSKEFIMVKQSLRELELSYNIKISDNQLAFIVRMVTENSVSV